MAVLFTVTFHNDLPAGSIVQTLAAAPIPRGLCALVQLDTLMIVPLQFDADVKRNSWLVFFTKALIPAGKYSVVAITAPVAVHVTVYEPLRAPSAGPTAHLPLTEE